MDAVDVWPGLSVGRIVLPFVSGTIPGIRGSE